MARTTTKLRLSTLEPYDAPRQAQDALFAVFVSLAKQLGLGHIIGPARPTTVAPLFNLLLLLRDFALTGQRRFWKQPSGPVHAVASIASMLYGPASDTTKNALGLLRSLPADRLEATPYGLVLLAAYARAFLDQGAPVTAREIAALGSLSDNYVRLIARPRDSPLRRISPGSELFTAPSAAAWLAAREVPGLTLAQDLPPPAPPPAETQHAKRPRKSVPS